MWEWMGLTGMGPREAVVLVLALPYLMMATGRLQPRKNVEDWKDAYFKSEGARAVEAETGTKVLAYLEAADKILRGISGHPAAPPAAPTVEDRDHVAKDD